MFRETYCIKNYNNSKYSFIDSKNNHYFSTCLELDNGASGCTDAPTQCRVVNAVCTNERCACADDRFLKNNQCVLSKHDQMHDQLFFYSFRM